MVAPQTQLLRVPPHVLGVADFHGRLVPLLDLTVRLGMCGPRKVLDLIQGYIVFVEIPSGVWGLVVDDLQDLIEAHVEPLAAQSTTLRALVLGSIRVSDTKWALLLDPTKLTSVVATARMAQELATLSGGGR